MSSREPHDRLKAVLDGVAGFGTRTTSQDHEWPVSGSERSWLLTGRAAADKRRARGTNSDLKQLLVGQGLRSSREPGLWRDFSDAMERRTVTEALSSLAPELREVVRLAYFEGYSNRALGEVLGLSVGQVRWRLREALVAMQAVMRRAGSRITSALLAIAGQRLGHAEGGRIRRQMLAPLPPGSGAGTARELLFGVVGTVAAAAAGVLLLNPAVTAESSLPSPPAAYLAAPAEALTAVADPAGQPAAAAASTALASGAGPPAPARSAPAARTSGFMAPAGDLAAALPKAAVAAAASLAPVTSASGRLASQASATIRRVEGVGVSGVGGVLPAATGTISGLTATLHP